ncbi:MAG: DUF5615 family PIN-like protein [Dehalococcoidia bacterium]
MRFYLDDDVYSPRILESARRLGLDITGPAESGHGGAPDDVHLNVAASTGRCLVTRNYGDFAQLTSSYAELGLPHAGVLFVPPSLSNEMFGAIARALKAYADAYPDGMPPYMIDFLTPTAD